MTRKAHKKKKRGQKRKRQTQQKKAKRQQRTKHAKIQRSPPTMGKLRLEEELAHDMAPLFAPPASNPEYTLLTIVLNSEELADEPEFEDLLIDPMLVAEMYWEKLGESYGDTFGESDVDLAGFADLDEEERKEIYLDALIETISRIMTPEILDDISGRLDRLRSRLKRSGKSKAVARVAAVRVFLLEDDALFTCSFVGLVSAIFTRSIDIAMQLTAVLDDYFEAVESSQSKGIPLLGKIRRTDKRQELGDLMNNVPGLRKYCDEKANSIWQAGLMAFVQGKPCLGIFSQKEIVSGLEILVRVFGFSSIEDSYDSPWPEISKEKGAKLAAELSGYLTNLLTPERSEQIRANIQRIQEESVVGERESYLEGASRFVLATVLDGDQTDLRAFLFAALTGEMNAYIERRRLINDSR